MAITTGDIDGIGLEIACKALAKLGPKKDFQFIIFRSPKASKKDLNRIDAEFKRITVSSWHEALSRTPTGYKELVDINSSLSPANWIETAAQAASLGHIDAITTAPITKSIIQEAGLADVGHTDILKRVSGAKDAFMGFVGNRFSLVVATGHIPLTEVSKELTKERLKKAILAAQKLRTLLNKKDATKPIGVLGLNPHAGEGGIIGEEEQHVHLPVIEEFLSKKTTLVGPLAADSCFFEDNIKKYSVIVSSYHDQGLIPFKALHKEHANVHITLGLPFVRTSVDHGTAKDIFGKNKADPSSMLRALTFGVDLCRNKFNLNFEKP